MWAGVQGLGFKGGKVLEPGMGVGHFLGLSPDAKIAFTGVELDPITGKIARALHPNADIRIQGFEEVALPEDTFDLTIGNVPFADYAPNDPVYNKGGHSIHNYFILKSLRMTKPGGYVAVITSSFTMDSASSKFRREANQIADLVGAVRLPFTAFKGNAGTEVVADMVILRRRKEGENPKQSENWLQTVDRQIDGERAKLNAYYAEHPDNVLGTLDIRGTMYGPSGMNVSPDTSRPLGEQIADALERIRQDAEANGTQFNPDPTETPASRNNDERDDTLTGPDVPGELDEGSLFVKDNKIFKKEFGEGLTAKVSLNAKDRVKRLIALRDTARQMLKEQQQEWDGTGKAPWADSQKNLNRLHDAFAKKYGAVSKFQTRRGVSTNKAGERNEYFYPVYKNVQEFKEDPAYPFLLAMDAYNEERDTFAKMPMFTERVASPTRELRDVKNLNDALVASMNFRGGVDLDYMVEISRRDRADIIEELKGQIYRNPGNGQWEPADQYLSGNVRNKLALAVKMAKQDRSFEENVSALEAVQPEDLVPGEIVARLGSPWVPAEDIEAFVADTFGDANARVSHIPSEGSWRVETRQRRSVAATEEWGTGRRDAFTLLQDGLNNKTPVVMDSHSDGTKTKNADETLKANEALQKIKERFADWVWEDEKRATRLARKYNDEFNNIVKRTFDGAHLTLPGSSNIIELRPHQKNAVWRTIQNGNSLYAHAVGAGKTFAAIASGMEMKRIGLVNKPAYVVPNHMLEQFSREFLLLYPTAKILVADKANFVGNKRRQFVAKVATGNWDAIVIKHSSFERIPISAKFEAEFLRDQINEYINLISEARAQEGKSSITVKELEKAKSRREERMKRLLAKGKKDKGITFEDAGIDYLFVDEFHLFKNLEFPTKMQGMAAPGSQRSEDMFLKIQYLEKQNPGRSITAMTATPIANSVAEMFTMQRYLQQPLLRERGLIHFDSWAGAFGDTVVAYELAPDGGSFRQSTRFAKFVNVPELSQMFAEVADVQTAADLNLPTPKLRGGKAGVEVVEATEGLTAYVADLVDRAEKVRNRAVPPEIDNMLKITTDGRKAALDLRLVGLPMDEERSKLARAAERIKEIYDRSAGNVYADPDTGLQDSIKGGVQMVFLDQSTPTKDGSFSVYNRLRSRLVDLGIPREEIAFIHDFATDEKKARLFKDVRAGKVRVLMGSTSKMGIGTNVQKRLVHKHDLDAPWRPADVEQRDGRIMRQGNQNEEIGIDRYVTEGSFDIYMWQTLERKAKFIAQVMQGSGSREVEDIDNSALTFAEVKALATGNPMIMEKAEVDGEVQRLDRLRRSHEQQQWKLKSRLGAIRGSIKANENELANLEKTIAVAEDTRGEAFKMTVGGESFTERKEAVAAVETAVIERLGRFNDTGQPISEKIGRLGGFDVSVTIDLNRFEKEANIYLSLDSPFEIGGQDIASKWNASGAVSKLQNGIGRLQDQINLSKLEIQRARGELAKAEGLVGKPFDKQAELDRLEARQKEIEEALKPPEQPEGPVAAEPATGSPDASQALRVGTGELTEAVVRDTDKIVARLTARMKQVGISEKVTLEVTERLRVMAENGDMLDSRGQFIRGDKVIQVSLEYQDESWTLDHEVVHALRELGLFRDAEWRQLRRAALADKQAMDFVRAVYEPLGLTEDRIVEERIANMFADWSEGRMQAGGFLKRAFEVIRDFLRALGRTFTGLGYQSVDEIFVAIEKGEIGGRIEVEQPQAAEATFDEATALSGEALSLPPRDPGSAEERGRQMQGFLSRGQLMDRAMRYPFSLFGGLNDQGKWEPAARAFARNPRTITGALLGAGVGSAGGPIGSAIGAAIGGGAGFLLEAKLSPRGRFGWLHSIVEPARMGLIDLYGLSPEFIDLRRKQERDEREINMRGIEILKTLKDQNVSVEEAKVLQAVMTGEPVSDADMERLAVPIRQAIDELGQEAVMLGLLSRESYERNRGAYLHRVFAKHEVDQNKLSKFVAQVMGKKRRQIIGNQFKGRGIFLNVRPERLLRDVPEMPGAEGVRELPGVGEHFFILDREAETRDGKPLEEDQQGRTLRRIYWPAHQEIPAEFEDYANRGEFEVRFIARGQITLWRDYTKRELESMGEITDARYTIGKTFMLMAHDLATGRFYKDIAGNREWATDQEPASLWVDSGEYSRRWADPEVQWVKVPDTDIPKSGGKKRWGALSGKYVRAAIWRDLKELDIMMRPNVWRKALTQWKLNKTARSPVVHMNNIMSNIMLMDMVDVRAQDLVDGISEFIKKGPEFREAELNGAFGADLVSQELRRDILPEILKELELEVTGSRNVVTSRFGAAGVLADGLWRKGKALDKKMVRIYQLEDEIFRMATYMRRRGLGDTPAEAARLAREQFLDYTISAPWVNMARNSVLPFIAYTYRAVPLIAQSIVTRPWKIGKYFLLAYMANQLAYMATGDDDDEEDRERRSLRKEERGYTWIGVPRMARMPWRDQWGNPVFLDIRRWIPAGDVYDMNQGSSAVPIPAPIQFGGPLMLAAEFALNKQGFTGQDITNELTDNWWDRAKGVGDWAWKSWLPSAAWIPGSWYWTKIDDARKGARDKLGRPLSLPQAIASSVGIKAKAQDIDLNFEYRRREFARVESALKSLARRDAEDLERGMIDQKEFDARMDRILDKMERLDERIDKTFTDKPRSAPRNPAPAPSP